MKYHLAQINVARARAPLDSDLMADFMNALAEINALAEGSPGFVWRFKEEGGNATQVKAFTDPLVIVNMSVWKDVESLKAYVFRSMHGRFFSRRAEWFEKSETAHVALWWIPEGTLPSLEEAKERLRSLDLNGESPTAFTFRSPHPPPAE